MSQILQIKYYLELYLNIMKRFSQRLKILLSSKQPKTLKDLLDSFAEKSFAILFLLLLAASALPIPTGGITNIFEIIAMLLAIELISGRKTVWLPKSWLNKELPKSLQSSALPRFIRIIRWFEKFSRPRLSNLLNKEVTIRLIGLVFLIFSLFSFLAPPFSGLDTLPSLGIVILALALIFEDFIMSVIAIIIGSIGVLLILILGKAALSLI